MPKHMEPAFDTSNFIRKFEIFPEQINAQPDTPILAPCLPVWRAVRAK